MIKIVESHFVKSAVKPVDYCSVPYAEIAVVGKSNVGKSSLINALLNRKKIAKVSSTPGKTRLINFFEVRVKRYDEAGEQAPDGFFSLADLPGYGYAKVSKTEREHWKTMIENYFRQREPLRAVLMLVDIRHDADPKDMVMMKMLIQHKRPFVVIATKSDKILKNKVQKTVRELAKQFGIDEHGILPFSAVKKAGLPDLLTLIEEVAIIQGEG